MTDDKDIDQTNKPVAYRHAEVSGAINQHTPPYWRLALPALGTRYIARYGTELWETGNRLKGIKVPSGPNRVFDALAGAWMLGITGFFAYRTCKDLKSIFGETVGYEFGKDHQDVNIADLMNSKNKTLVVARNNSILYTAIRAGVNSLFFTSFMPEWMPFSAQFRNTQAVDLGVGANGAYLVSEILGRGRTFFEQVQSFIDMKISSKNAFGDEISPMELMQLYQRNAMDNDKENVFNAKTHPDIIKNSRVIFDRMAELMNHTYLNKVHGDEKNFPLPKFLYLLGFNLVQPKKVEQSLLYVEVANTYGIPFLKEVVKEVESGAKISDLATKYHVTLPAIKSEVLSRSKGANVIPVAPVEAMIATKKFSDGLNGMCAMALPPEKQGESFVGRIKEAPVGPALQG